MDISACSKNAQWPSACFCEQVDSCSKLVTTGHVSSCSCFTETVLTLFSNRNLPLSVDSSKLTAFYDQNQLKSPENAVPAAPLEPLLQPPTHPTVTARLCRCSIPWNSASHSIDVRVEHGARTAPGGDQLVKQDGRDAVCQACATMASLEPAMSWEVLCSAILPPCSPPRFGVGSHTPWYALLMMR
jgi:hypothetical protein